MQFMDIKNKDGEFFVVAVDFLSLMDQQEVKVRLVFTVSHTLNN